MLIINAVAVHFYARFLKEKKKQNNLLNNLSYPRIASTPSKLMSTLHSFTCLRCDVAFRGYIHESSSGGKGLDS